MAAMSNVMMGMIANANVKKIRVELADGTFYQEEFCDGQRTYTEWSERDRSASEQVLEWIEKNGKIVKVINTRRNNN